jgi:hypothetical protein
VTDQNAIVVHEGNQIQLGSLTATNPKDLIERASGIATELKSIITKRSLSKMIQGREFVVVDGWTTMGAMLGVTAREVTQETRELENGDWEATVELCRVSDGSVIGRGSALVGMDEIDRTGKQTWGSRPKYARRSMAVTRATGKAFRISFSWIMSLAGYATTPAEEMDGIVDGEYSEDRATPQKQSNKKQSAPERPYQPEALKKALAYKIANSTVAGAPSEKQVGLLAAMLDLCFAGEEKASDIRHAVTEYLTGFKSVKDMPGSVVKVLLDWLDAKQDNGGEYQPNVMAVKEARAVRTQALKDAGQMDLLDTAKDLGGEEVTE